MKYYDGSFDSMQNMLHLPFASPGYHSRIPGGTLVHPVRESFIYALALLQRGSAADVARSTAVLQKLLPLQDRTASSATCGVWPWLLEEPLNEMDSPDMNWADFCGASVGHIITLHRTQLTAPLVAALRNSLRLAAEAIRRRNVKPGYTNIAIMGGGVCTVAGEQLKDNGLLYYGRQRLEAVVQYTQRTGGFNEYNSPPYSKVVIAECERTLQLAADLRARRAAEHLRCEAWKAAAASFHAPTQQWAGPHSRNSRLRLRRSSVEFIRQRTGAPLKPHPAMQAGEPRGYAVVAARRCPADLIHHYHVSVTRPRGIHRVFERNRAGEPVTHGVTWMDDTACLGSVNRSTFWTQRKPLVAYWRTAQDAAMAFRVRFLHDGRDFASMGIRTMQHGQRTISAVHPVAGQGDWHPSLDRPTNGVFSARDLRLRFELLGQQATAARLSAGRFSLGAGARRVILHAAPATFAASAISWQTGQQSEHAFIDAVCYQGPPQAFDYSQAFRITCVFGLELLNTAAKPATRPPQISRHAARWRVAGKRLEVPLTG